MMSGMAWDIIGMIAVGVGVAAVLYAASHALRKAGIPDEGGLNRMARDQTHQQSGGGAAISHVERICRLQQAADPDAVHDPLAVAVALDPCAHRPHCGGGGEHILPFEQSADPALANRERRQHQRTVADRLVARHFDQTVKRTVESERGGARRGAVHGEVLCCHAALKSTLTLIFDRGVRLWQGRRLLAASLLCEPAFHAILKGLQAHHGEG